MCAFVFMEHWWVVLGAVVGPIVGSFVPIKNETDSELHGIVINGILGPLT